MNVSNARVFNFLEAIEERLKTVREDSVSRERLLTAWHVLRWILWIPPGTKETRDFPIRFLEENER